MSSPCATLYAAFFAVQALRSQAGSSQLNRVVRADGPAAGHSAVGVHLTMRWTQEIVQVAKRGYCSLTEGSGCCQEGGVGNVQMTEEASPALKVRVQIQAWKKALTEGPPASSAAARSGPALVARLY